MWTPFSRRRMGAISPFTIGDRGFEEGADLLIVEISRIGIRCSAHYLNSSDVQSFLSF